MKCEYFGTKEGAAFNMTALPKLGSNVDEAVNGLTEEQLVHYDGDPAPLTPCPSFPVPQYHPLPLGSGRKGR